MSDSDNPQSIFFAAYHQPILESGDYKIQIAQTLKTTDGTPSQKAITTNNQFSSERYFTVEGDRFHLKPEVIQAVFPPDGGIGDYENVLPHIVLNRSTLPWEHFPDGTQTVLPWMVLLLFDDTYQPQAKTITLGELVQSNVKFPPVTLNKHQQASDPVSVIDVPLGQLAPLLPKRADLPFVAFVRRMKFAAGDSNGLLEDQEEAVVIGSRLPKAGVNHIVHLVSVEGRYDPGSGEFSFGTTDPAALIRLVSLYSWPFACVAETQSFSFLVKELVRNHQAFRLPTSSNPDTEAFLQEGYVPVHHLLRQGGQTASWYRSPFVNGTLPVVVDVPVHTSDALLRYHAEVGMLDVSYAAAWELGRLLALQNQTVSTDLYAWKRARDQARKRSNEDYQTDHPLVVLDIPTKFPDQVGAWLDDLSYFEGVPFKYLVPDERLLPPESIRFFQVDVNWVKCLLDGAYSMGRVTSYDFDRDRATPRLPPYNQISGVLIRSALVPGYPHLLIDAYDANSQPLVPLPTERLSDNILLRLFQGELSRLDLHQKPEKMHFALELPMGTPDQYAKTLRTKPKDSPITGVLSPERVVSLREIAEKIGLKLGLGTPDVGQFVINMLETSERVSFYRKL